MARVEVHRLVVLGAGRVGKTALIKRFLQDEYSDSYVATVDDIHKQLFHAAWGKTYHMEILDTAGSHQFPAMRHLNIQSGQGFLIVYATDHPASLRDAIELVNLVRTIKGDDRVPICLCANKSDICNTKENHLEKKLGGKIPLETVVAVETSASQNVNVNMIFENMFSSMTFFFSAQDRRRSEGSLVAKLRRKLSLPFKENARDRRNSDSVVDRMHVLDISAQIEDRLALLRNLLEFELENRKSKSDDNSQRVTPKRRQSFCLGVIKKASELQQSLAKSSKEEHLNKNMTSCRRSSFCMAANRKARRSSEYQIERCNEDKENKPNLMLVCKYPGAKQDSSASHEDDEIQRTISRRRNTFCVGAPQMSSLIMQLSEKDRQREDDLRLFSTSLKSSEEDQSKRLTSQQRHSFSKDTSKTTRGDSREDNWGQPVQTQRRQSSAAQIRDAQDNHKKLSRRRDSIGCRSHLQDHVDSMGSCFEDENCNNIDSDMYTVELLNGPDSIIIHGKNIASLLTKNTHLTSVGKT